MRIWHLMVVVLVSGIVAALLARNPVLGVLVSLDVLLVSFAKLLLRDDRCVQVFWSRASRPGDPPRRLGEKLSLWGDAFVVILDHAISALVITIAASLEILIAM